MGTVRLFAASAIKKLWAQEGSLFCIFKFHFGGCRGQIVGFPDHWGQFRFCFFKYGLTQINVRFRG
jgi:hypothetical protein